MIMDGFEVGAIRVGSFTMFCRFFTYFKEVKIFSHDYIRGSFSA